MKKKTFLSKTELPKIIKDFINDSSLERFRYINDYHRSGDIIVNVDNEYILKISNNPMALIREKKANDYLNGKVKVSKSIIYEEYNGKGYYLKTCVKGFPLCSPKYLKKPELVVDLLAEAINIIHSIKINDCDYFSPEYKREDCTKEVYVHGDCCLPNILIYRNKVSGFIDMEGSGIGEPWIDYSWALWSLGYNLETDKYNDLFLKKLNVTFDELKYKKYVPY